MPPLSFPSPSPSLLPPLGVGKGIQLGLGILVGLPPWCALLGRRPPPPPPLYTWPGGTPKDTKISLSRVRCPPPQFTTSVILS